MPARAVEDGSGAWRWFGGRPSLDFVNTVRRRYASSVETLRAESDLALWLRAAKVTPVCVEVDPRGLRAARQLREAINDAVTAVVQGKRAPARAVDEINRWLVRGANPPALVDRGGMLELREDGAPASLEECLAALALDAALLLGSGERARLRVCAAEQCGIRFFDRSPAGRRQWCSSARCGNVERARRFRQRHAPRDE
jgi:predicted RNA-binding Zn ribbon-like protein